MTRWKIQRTCLWLAGCCFLAMTNGLSAQGPKKTVFIFQSYASDAAPFNAVSSALHERLRRRLMSEWPAMIARMDMDLTRHKEMVTAETAIAGFKEKLKGMDIALVITLGDPAARLMAKVRREAFPGVPVLMVACDERTTAPELKGSNTVIVAQQFAAKPSLENILRVLPGTTNVLVVAGASPPEMLIAHQLHQAYEGLTNRASFRLTQRLPFEQLADYCSKLPPRSAIFYASLAVDAAGIPYDYDFALRKLLAVANAPVFALYESQFGDRVVGGPLMPDTTLGADAADVAMRILKGEKPESIDPPVSVLAPSVYDGRELKRWHIDERNLPPGSRVVSRPPTAWEQYRTQILVLMTGIVVQTALIVGLLVNRAKRREEQAMATLIADLSSRFINLPADLFDHEIEAAQRRVCESLGLDVSSLWQWRPDNPVMHTLTHYYRPLGGPPVPQTMKGQDYFPWCQRRVLAGEVVIVSSLAELPAEAARDREVFSFYGLKTTLTIPLSVGGGPVFGSVNFNDMRTERRWSGALVQRLQMVAQIIANALARKVADQALRDSEARLSLAADAAGVGLWSLNLVTACFWLTGKTRELFKFTSGEEVTLERFLSLVHPDDRSPVRETIRAMVQARSEGHVQYRVVWPDGQVRWMLSRGRVSCGTSGEPECLMGVTVDITERKNAEMEALELRRRLAHVARVSTVGELAASLAHELNQPLAAIMANADAAEILVRGPNPDLAEIQNVLDDIRRDGMRAGDTIHRMRAFLQRHEIDMQPVDVESLVRESAKFVEMDALKRRVALQFSVEPGMPPAHGDRVQLQQVLLNLMVNGMDAMSALSEKTRHLSVNARRVSADMIEVSVGDQGHGIPPEEMATVFEPFFTTKRSGLGMGLAICRSIVTAHGGRIWLENNPSGGATARFTVPVDARPHAG